MTKDLTTKTQRHKRDLSKSVSKTLGSFWVKDKFLLIQLCVFVASRDFVPPLWLWLLLACHMYKLEPEHG
jgi:hypothetical protein